MITLIISIILGFIGMCLGDATGCQIYLIIFGMIGFFGPSIYLIEEIYKKNKRP